MLIFLFGEDIYRLRLKLKEMESKFIKEIDPQGGSLKKIDGKFGGFSDIIEIFSAGSLLTKKRLIIIDDILLNKNQNIFDKLLDYFKSKAYKNNENIIIMLQTGVKSKKVRNKEELLIVDNSGREKPLAKQPAKFFKFLSEQKYFQQFNLLNNSQVAAWIKKEVESRGGKITNKAVESLNGLIGNDLWRISNEIDKLINLKNSQKLNLTDSKTVEIGEDDIKQMVRGSYDENIFALTDALSVRNKPLAIKLLDEQRQAGLSDSYLLNMIIRQFKILLEIKQAVDNGFSSRKIASLLKIHPFVIQKGLNQVRNFELGALKKIFNQLINIDYLMKTGVADAQTMIDMLIAKA